MATSRLIYVDGLAFMREEFLMAGVISASVFIQFANAEKFVRPFTTEKEAGDYFQSIVNAIRDFDDPGGRQ